MAVLMVTGGTGYIGRQIVARATARGHSVTTYNRDYVGPDVHASVRHVHGELFDLPRLVRALTEARVERVIHAAGMSHPDFSLEFPLTTIAANLDGTACLLEAMRMTEIRRIINFSSECAYGNRPEAVVTEDCPLEPTTPYGVTKVAGELLLNVYRTRYGFDPTSLRVTEVYGQGNRVPQILCDILNAVSAERPFHLARGQEHAFQFVHVEDVARATVLAAEADELPRPAYNVSGAEFVSLAELAEAVRQVAGPGVDIEIGPGRLDGDVLGPFDITAAWEDLGYSPEWTLERGIRAYLDGTRQTSALPA